METFLENQLFLQIITREARWTSENSVQEASGCKFCKYSQILTGQKIEQSSWVR